MNKWNARHTAAVSPLSTASPPQTRARVTSTAPPMSADTARVLLWEVRIARGCLDSFNHMLTAHAFLLSLVFAVNIIGFLQPPRGWVEESGRMFPGASLAAFSFFNSTSLCTTTSGLLFYIYCSHSAIVSLQRVPLPDHLNDAQSVDLLNKIWASLRLITLPSLQRRCSILFFAVAGSLTSSILAYFFAAYAATNPGKQRFIGVILPAIVGGTVMSLVLCITASKLALELDFKTRFEKLWITLGGDPICNPELHTLALDDMQALDPLPFPLTWWYYRDAKSRNEMLDKEEPLHKSARQVRSFWKMGI